MKPSARAPSAGGDVAIARAIVGTLGGRYSMELGIDVDGGEAEIERWFLAATLFGSRISATAAKRTFGVLSSAGCTSIATAGDIPWHELVEHLDRGGYTRYDFRTATRLQMLAKVIAERHGGSVATIGRTITSYPALRDTLDALPGWGPVTVQLFLRELRGTWPGSEPPLDERAWSAGLHLSLFDEGSRRDRLQQLYQLADAAELDRRDLESGLVRLALAHHSQMDRCPGGGRCTALHIVNQRRGGAPEGERQ